VLVGEWPLTFAILIYVLEYVIRRVHEHKETLEMNVAHDLEMFSFYVHFLTHLNSV
jgi:hypothetical protein